ncbi:hypothetical protein GCM10009001_29170 [Virgibacillus siamensis]|uniref:Uncharacterized protein n=1 Tax=Virgibacillus siamensis TaxID=480071 RepID=A0ABP3RGS2_9BACI
MKSLFSKLNNVHLGRTIKVIMLFSENTFYCFYMESIEIGTIEEESISILFPGCGLIRKMITP